MTQNVTCFDLFAYHSIVTRSVHIIEILHYSMGMGLTKWGESVEVLIPSSLSDAVFQHVAMEHCTPITLIVIHRLLWWRDS